MQARGRAFGFHRAADTLGAVIGPLLGLLGYELLGHRLRPLLIIAVIPAVLSVLLVAAVHERPARSAARPSGNLRAAARELSPSYWRVVAVLAVFSLVNFPDALLLLRLHEIGFSVVAVILAYVGYNAVYAAASYPAGLLADRLSQPCVFGVGLLFFAVGYLGLGITRSHDLAWSSLACMGCSVHSPTAWAKPGSPASSRPNYSPAHKAHFRGSPDSACSPPESGQAWHGATTGESHYWSRASLGLPSPQACSSRRRFMCVRRPDPLPILAARLITISARTQQSPGNKANTVLQPAPAHFCRGKQATSRGCGPRRSSAKPVVRDLVQTRWRRPRALSRQSAQDRFPPSEGLPDLGRSAHSQRQMSASVVGSSRHLHTVATVSSRDSSR